MREGGKERGREREGEKRSKRVREGRGRVRMGGVGLYEWLAYGDFYESRGEWAALPKRHGESIGGEFVGSRVKGEEEGENLRRERGEEGNGRG